jgi:hypothetical protein
VVVEEPLAVRPRGHVARVDSDTSDSLAGRHYGRLVRDGRENAIGLLDELSAAADRCSRACFGAGSRLSLDTARLMCEEDLSGLLRQVRERKPEERGALAGRGDNSSVL